MNKQQSAFPVRMNINSQIFNAVFFIFQYMALNILILSTLRGKNLKEKNQNNSEKMHEKIIQLPEPEDLCKIHCVKTCPPCLLYLKFHNLLSYKYVFKMF